MCVRCTDRWMDGRMDQWKGKIKKKGLRRREKDVRTGGQADDGCTQTDRWRKKTAERTALR